MNLPNKLSDKEQKMFDNLLFNFGHELIGGMNKEAFLTKYEWYMAEMRNKLIAENQRFIGIPVSVEGWLYSLNLSSVNHGLKRLDKLKSLDKRMDCITDILSVLMANDIAYADYEDEIKDLALN